MKEKVSTEFNTTIIKIALNQCESQIASCLVAYYNGYLNEEMIQRALKSD